MSQPLTDLPAPKPPRKRRRWLWFVGIALSVVLLLIGGTAGYYWFQMYSLDRELQAVIAELDENDPHWRLHEIEAQRPELPDEKNAALVVITAHSKLPDDWGSKLKSEIFFVDEPPPPVQFNDMQIEALRSELQSGQAGLEEAKKLTNYDTGHYPIKYSKDWFSTPTPDVDKAVDVAYLLRCDAKLLAQDGKIEEAWESSKALYHAGMALGNTDLPVVMIARVAIRANALGSMERVLAQGEVKAEWLDEMQKLLEKDIHEPILLVAFRGERAGQHMFYSAIEDGTTTLSEVSGGKLSKEVEKFALSFDPGMVKRSHIYVVKLLTEMIETIKEKNDQKIREKMEFLEDKIKAEKGRLTIPLLAGLLLPALHAVSEVDIRSRVQMQCAICALAAERYRLKHERWPDSLETLAQAGLIKEIPIDPYSGEPLRYRQTENGIIIFSIGPKHHENQGDSLDNPDLEEPRMRLEFRLWNPDRRRQPPRPPKKEDDLLLDF